MPRIRVNDVELFYEEQGTGDEVIVFAHGLLLSHRMFDAQVHHFKDRFRCIAYDHRGQGRSEVTPSGYEMDNIYEDAAAFIDALNVGPVHFVGLSMGGYTGQRLAARRPDLVKSLILMETSADDEPEENLPQYAILRIVARWLSPRLVARPALNMMFGETFRSDPANAEVFNQWVKHVGNMDRAGAAKAAKGVFSRGSVYEEIAKITAPTLIIVGDEDVPTPVDHAERIHAQIEGSSLVILPDTGHSSTIESPDLVTQAMEDFYTEIGVL
jgi:3-oxoadipate enol-lactonase